MEQELTDLIVERYKVLEKALKKARRKDEILILGSRLNEIKGLLKKTNKNVLFY